MNLATLSLGNMPVEDALYTSVLTYHSPLDKELKGCFILGDNDPDVPVHSIMLQRSELTQLRDWCSRILDLDYEHE